MTERSGLVAYLRKSSLVMAPEGEAFTLASGQQSDRYHDVRMSCLGSAARLAEIARALAGMIPPGTSFVGAVPTGGLVLLGPVLQARREATGEDLPGFYVRESAKAHGLSKRVEGALSGPGDVCLVEDTVSTAQSVLHAVEAMRADGRRVTAVVCVLDRELGGRERLGALGIPLHALATMTEIEAGSGLS